MNIKEAYQYMYKELCGYYARTHNVGVGDIISDFNTSLIGKPLDPAAWTYWLNAVRKVTEDEILSETDTIKAITILLKEFNDHHGFKLKDVIKYYKKKERK
jgi:hypothetical protein